MSQSVLSLINVAITRAHQRICREKRMKASFEYANLVKEEMRDTIDAERIRDATIQTSDIQPTPDFPYVAVSVVVRFTNDAGSRRLAIRKFKFVPEKMLWFNNGCRDVCTG